MKLTTVRISPLLHNLLLSASVIVIIAGMRAASPLLGPLMLALFLAMLLYPAYQWLLNRGIPTWLTVSLMIVGILLVGVGTIALLWLSIEQLRTNLFLYASRLTAQAGRFQLWLEALGVDAPRLLTQELLNRQLVISTTTGLLTTVGSLLSTTFFVLVATIFLLLQSTHLSARFENDLESHNVLSTQALQVAQRVAHFFSIRVRVNLVVAAGITLWLLVLGVDLAVLWGILAFFLGFVMYVGLAIAALFPALLALAETGPTTLILVIAGFFIINVAVENVLAPAMMAQGLNLAPVVTLASLLFWVWVLGPLGFILAIPLTVIVVMILASYNETQWLVPLLTMDRPPGIDPKSVVDVPVPVNGSEMEQGA
ncbi:MAG TPA: AI-2E family transporter [Caldilineaceae bacterium]|nr:AI-2E family transporter [Caldilineaceae bacterium]